MLSSGLQDVIRTLPDQVKDGQDGADRDIRAASAPNSGNRDVDRDRHRSPLRDDNRDFGKDFYDSGRRPFSERVKCTKHAQSRGLRISQEKGPILKLAQTEWLLSELFGLDAALLAKSVVRRHWRAHPKEHPRNSIRREWP